MTDGADGVARVRLALRAAGLEDAIRSFPEGTRTAADAAAAIGCDVAAIAKSIVFRAGDRPILAIASGANRVSKAKLAALVGMKLAPAGPDFVREATGFPPGGVSPVGHVAAIETYIDEDLCALPNIWAAAGTAEQVFALTPAVLIGITGGKVADIKTVDG